MSITQTTTAQAVQAVRRPAYFLIPLNIMLGFALWAGICLFAYAENGARHLLTAGLGSTFVAVLLLLMTIVTYVLENRSSGAAAAPTYIPHRGYTRRHNG